ncbi:MFS transporter [Novosphingobium sp. SG720]|uniref:MFS transporter n=1 Tax=Novosphingobium sp. SG720 TaxID=2586998 RepID=UPI0014464FD2|nr:MFS transporter [Novosphingobium sp. SG720]NKJ44425.1 putative MFS family arabinose efflux permease [Novosphingobium sp. SG720]
MSHTIARQPPEHPIDGLLPGWQGTSRQVFTLVLVYAIGLGSMAMVGMLSPLTALVARDFSSGPAAIGWTISLFSLPAAITSTLGGGLVDRLGPRRVLILAPLLLAVADLGLVQARALWLFDLSMVLAGIAYVGVLNGGAAMLMTTLGGSLRARGMALWATYAPAGFSAGLLLAALVAQWASWRLAFAAHGAVMLACVAGAMLLPRVASAPRDLARSPLAQLRAGVTNPVLLLLALAAALPNMVSYGTSLVAAGWLAKTHGVSLAASAGIVAGAKILAVLAGSTVTGALLARAMRPLRLFAAMATVGVLAQALLFVPASPLAAAVAGLMGWVFAFGALSGVCMALLPRVAERAGGAGLGAGIVNQFVSLASFLTPAIYFGLGSWHAWIAVAAGALLLSLAALRHAGRLSEGELSA